MCLTTVAAIARLVSGRWDLQRLDLGEQCQYQDLEDQQDQDLCGGMHNTLKSSDMCTRWGMLSMCIAGVSTSMSIYSTCTT